MIITSASFEAKLSDANGRMVNIKGTFAGDPLDSSFLFNFGDPKKAVETFERNLVK